MRRRKVAGTEDGTPEEFRYKGLAEFMDEHPELETLGSDDEGAIRDYEESCKRGRQLGELMRAGKIHGKISYKKEV